MLVSRPVLCEKALQLHVQWHMGDSVPPFQASRGWLWRFCNRHGIKQFFAWRKGLLRRVHVVYAIHELLAASRIWSV